MKIHIHIQDNQLSSQEINELVGGEATFDGDGKTAFGPDLEDDTIDFGPLIDASQTGKVIGYGFSLE